MKNVQTRDKPTLYSGKPGCLQIAMRDVAQAAQATAPVVRIGLAPFSVVFSVALEQAVGPDKSNDKQTLRKLD